MVAYVQETPIRFAKPLLNWLENNNPLKLKIMKNLYGFVSK
jgi:hypothetical protein